VNSIEVIGIGGDKEVKYELSMPFGMDSDQWQVYIDNYYQEILHKVRGEWRIYLHPTTVLTVLK